MQLCWFSFQRNGLHVVYSLHTIGHCFLVPSLIHFCFYLSKESIGHGFLVPFLYIFLFLLLKKKLIKGSNKKTPLQPN